MSIKSQIQTLFNYYFSVVSDYISSVFFSAVVCFGVTLTAQQLEVIPIKSDLRIVDRERIYFDSMVNNLTRLVHATPQTVLAQISSHRCVIVPAILPAFRTVETSCVIFSHDSLGKTKGGSLRPVSFAFDYVERKHT